MSSRSIRQCPTFAPSPPSASAIARPMPREAPVTTATSASAKVPLRSISLGVSRTALTQRAITAIIVFRKPAAASGRTVFGVAGLAGRRRRRDCECAACASCSLLPGCWAPQLLRQCPVQLQPGRPGRACIGKKSPDRSAGDLHGTQLCSWKCMAVPAEPEGSKLPDATRSLMSDRPQSDPMASQCKQRTAVRMRVMFRFSCMPTEHPVCTNGVHLQGVSAASRSSGQRAPRLPSARSSSTPSW